MRSPKVSLSEEESVTQLNRSSSSLLDDSHQKESSSVKNPCPTTRHVDLSLKVPPRPSIFGNSRSGKNLTQSPNSSTRGILRALTFKRNRDGERSALLDSDQKAGLKSPVLADFMSTFSGKKCASVPVTPASHLFPLVSSPTSAGTSLESKRSHIMDTRRLKRKRHALRKAQERQRCKLANAKTCSKELKKLIQQVKSVEAITQTLKEAAEVVINDEEELDVLIRIKSNHGFAGRVRYQRPVTDQQSDQLAVLIEKAKTAEIDVHLY